MAQPFLSTTRSVERCQPQPSGKLSAIFELLTAILIVIGMASVAAAEGLVLKNEVKVEVVTLNDKGEQVVDYVPADKAAPGDVVIYRIFYTNSGEEPADGIVLASQIPPALLIIEDSVATGIGSVEFSVDGGNNFANRDALTVRDEKGEERPAEAGDLTNIRWAVSAALEAGESGTVSYRAVVR